LKTYKEFGQFWTVLSLGIIFDAITTTYGLSIGFIESNTHLNMLLGVPSMFVIGFTLYEYSYRIVEQKRIVNIMPYIYLFGFITLIAPLINLITLFGYIEIISLLAYILVIYSIFMI
jgi:hypothetical protein